MSKGFLVEHFSSYGSYHNNGVNKFIHIICVPIIVWSLLVMIRPIPFDVVTSSVEVLKTLPSGWEAHWGMPALVLLILYYFLLDFGVGLVASVLFAFLFYSSNVFAVTIPNSYNLAIAIHVVSWILQFIGHGVFEKRRPALLDNILQVFVAPFFVTLEVMFMVGYKPAVHRECQKRIGQNILAMNRANKKAQ
eukprot:GILI01010754.1.p2 GENE.GILI01010754.1~~GILI01010754.1.p2  ORF type:complete len:210 (+),score=56.07 GILI01010754.1:55-630(+)